MKNFITKKEVEQAKPIKPKYLRWRMLLAGFITIIFSSILLFFMSLGMSYFIMDNATTSFILSFSLVFSITVPLILGLLFTLMIIIDNKSNMFYNFIQKWVGIRKYSIENKNYESLKLKYKQEKEFKKQQEKYKKYK